jgi:hypothetical protein
MRGRRRGRRWSKTRPTLVKDAADAGRRHFSARWSASTRPTLVEDAADAGRRRGRRWSKTRRAATHTARRWSRVHGTPRRLAHTHAGLETGRNHDRTDDRRRHGVMTIADDHAVTVTRSMPSGMHETTSMPSGMHDRSEVTRIWRGGHRRPRITLQHATCVRGGHRGHRSPFTFGGCTCSN